MKGKKPTKEDLVDLKNRHGLTYKTMAEPLYGVPPKTVENWVRGHRDCPALAWKELVLAFDGVDVRDVLDRTVFDRFKKRGELLAEALDDGIQDLDLARRIQEEIR